MHIPGRLLSAAALVAVVALGCGYPPPSPVNSSLTVALPIVTADGQAQVMVSVLVRDKDGKGIPEQQVTFSVSGGGNTLSVPKGKTDTHGTLTTALSSTVAELKTITAEVGGIQLTGTVTFLPGSVSESTSSLTADPPQVAADGVAATTLTFKVADALGNPFRGKDVTFGVTGTGNVLSAASGQTDGNGVVTTTLTSSYAEVKTVTATMGTFTLSTTVAFKAGLPSSTTSSFIATPSTRVADGVSASTLTLTLKDVQGNPVSDEPVTLTATGTSNAITPSSGSTDAQGVFTAAFSSPRAEMKTVTVSAGGLQLTATVNFIPGPISTANSTFSATPTSLLADNAATTTLQLQLYDAQNNPIANTPVSITSSGTGNTIVPGTGNTSAQGAFTATMRSGVAGMKTVTASAGGRTFTQNVAFLAGPPSQAASSFAINPSQAQADGQMAVNLLVTLKDATGNPCAALPVTFSSTGTGNTITPSSGVTDASGNFLATFRSTKAELKTVTLDANGQLTLTGTATFVPGPPSLSTSSLTANPTSVTADGSAQSTLTLVVRDLGGNAVSGASVSLASTGTGNTLSPTSGTTDVNGNFVATFKSTVAQAKTVTATVSTAAGSIAPTAQVTFVPGPPSATTSTLAANPLSTYADGTSQSTITFTVKDAGGNLLPNQAVTLSATGTGNTLAPTSGTTNASGVFTATLTSTVAEQKTLTATAGALTLTTNVYFTAGPPSSANSTFTLTPANVTADGTSAATLTVTVRDNSNQPIANHAVTLSSTGTGNTFVPAQGITDAAGVFTAQMTSTAAELKTVTATFGPVSKTATVTFTPGLPSGTTSTFVASPSTAQANGTATITLTATVKDANGNLVPGASVAITSTGTNNIFAPNPPNGTTGANGQFSVTLASTTIETKTVSAQVNAAFSMSTSVTFGTCDVLVLGDNSATETQNLVNALNAAGMTATGVTNGATTYAGTPAASSFSVIIVTNGNNWSSDMPSAGQTAILNASNAGKGVIFTEWFAYEIENGRFLTLAPLQLLQRSGGTTATSTFTVNSTYASHPIWAGVPSSFTTAQSIGFNTGAVLLNGGQSVAQCTACSGPGVVLKDAPGRIVQFAHAANYSMTTNTFWTGEPNLRQLMINAAKWAGRCGP